MHIENRKKSNKPRVVVIATIAIVTLVLGVMFVTKTGLFMPIASNNNDNSSLSKDEKTAANTIKDRATEDAKKNTEGTGSDPLPQPTQPEGPSKPVVGLDITSVNQDSTTLRIRTIVQSVSSSGNCTISMKGPSGKSYTEKVEAQPLPSSSTCKGFDIPISSLSKGDWTVTINYEDAGVTGSATKEVSVQ